MSRLVTRKVPASFERESTMQLSRNGEPQVTVTVARPRGYYTNPLSPCVCAPLAQERVRGDSYNNHPPLSPLPLREGRFEEL